jgi:hypothetical protein
MMARRSGWPENKTGMPEASLNLIGRTRLRQAERLFLSDAS